MSRFLPRGDLGTDDGAQTSLACEQALHLGHIVKRRRARGDAKAGGGERERREYQRGLSRKIVYWILFGSPRKKWIPFITYAGFPSKKWIPPS